MTSDFEPLNPATAEWMETQRKWDSDWRGLLLPNLFLAYLVYVLIAVHDRSVGAGAIAGYVLVGVFAVLYIFDLSQSRTGSTLVFWTTFGVLCGVFVAELPFAHESAFVMCVYLTSLAVTRLGTRGLPIVVVLEAAAIFTPVAVHSWHDGILTSFQDVIAVALPIVALVVLATMHLIKTNEDLAIARSQIARLAAENERSRIARDLHDLLGHSLTAITVKAGLAARLGNSDPPRAIREISEVEALARRSLADVRAAVGNYRDVTLAGELASGRELLRAAGIAADLPRAVEVVDPTHQELFGWVVREGLTNVVRHAHAHSCTVRLSQSSVEILDDGVGGSNTSGNGLSGLRERVSAVGGVVDVGPIDPTGWCLRVSLQPVVAA
jgi:two-component system sensor histidine kinase DesK